MSRDGLWRAMVLIAACAICAIVIVDWTRVPTEELAVGDVAPRTVKAPVTFKYQDFLAYEELREEARQTALPVFVHQSELRDELSVLTRTAFANARAQLASDAQQTDPNASRRILIEQLHRDLRIVLDAGDVGALADADFNQAHEALTLDLLNEAIAGMVVTDRTDLPKDGAIQVIELSSPDQDQRFEDLDSVITVEEARQRVSLRALNHSLGGTPTGKAAATVARALVRANLSFSPLETEQRRGSAVASVRMAPSSVKRGAILFREGDTLTKRDVLIYDALQAQQGDQTIALEWVSLAFFLLLLIASAYNFGASFMEGFDTRLRNVISAAVLLVLTAIGARVVVATSFGTAALVGYEAEPSSVWFLMPMAGAVMLVRLLMGLSWSVMFTVVASVTMGLVMDLQLLPVAFFLISGLTAAASVEHTRERIAVLRAGLQVGLVNAATVLVIHFIQLSMIDGEVTLATTMRPVWSILFALGGGILSSFLVLGVTPLFESMGFVTDYRLMELANLNHPMMRQLMLRAPGSYHHSVMVGSLAEASAEAIGANALQAKVAAYFHDIGKSLKPQYFIENQGKGGNRHHGLDPHTSAQIIISHVTEGGRMAEEHKLPKPIQDNIWMHHGTGILQFFYAAACEQASSGASVDEAPFRYPGPKPNTREAGIIMLADKVEAATRTIKSPSEDNIRAMISRIVSSVMADGQFSECPLTFQEIHTIADTFVTVLLGIYHQRIEYPQTAEISRGAPAAASTVPKEALITLELHPGQRAPVEEPVEVPDPTQVAQGQQTTTPAPIAPHPALTRSGAPGEGDEMPPPVTAALGGAMGDEDAVDYEAVRYLPLADR